MREVLAAVPEWDADRESSKGLYGMKDTLFVVVGLLACSLYFWVIGRTEK